MLRTERICLKRIHPLSRTDFGSLTEAILKTRFADDVSEGFVDIESTEAVLRATLVVRRQALHTVLLRGSLTEQHVTYYECVPLMVELDKKLLTVFAGKEKASIAAAVSGRLLQFRHAIEDVRLDQQWVHQAMSGAGYQLRVTQLAIRDFQPIDGAYGQFVAKVTDGAVGLTLLKEYSDCVTDVVYDVESPARLRFTLRTGRAGIIWIRAEDRYVDNTLAEVKTALLAERKAYA